MHVSHTFDMLFYKHHINFPVFDNSRGWLVFAEKSSTNGVFSFLLHFVNSMTLYYDVLVSINIYMKMCMRQQIDKNETNQDNITIQIRILYF